MEPQETICIALISAILVICYLSPNLDCFNNVEFFGDLGLQGMFPFFNKEQIKSNESEAINYKTIQNFNGMPNNQSYLHNYDGSIVNGYQPSIIRPLNTTDYTHRGKDGELCSWPMYAGNGNKQKWCNEKNAIDYYAMRPLKTPTTYNGWLTNLFGVIVNPGNNVSNILDSKLVPKMFCWNGELFDGEDEKKKVMKWLMRKVAEGVNKIPAMKKNSTWGNEEYHYTDDEMYAFTTDNNKGSVYKLIFNLYNPLRSTATLVEAVVINPSHQGVETDKYVLAKMDFVNKGEWNCTDTELPEGMQGYNLPKANGDAGIDVNSRGMPKETVMKWNYANTLNKQEFNEFGFYDPASNVNIKGGVPESLKQAISQHDNKMLLDPAQLAYSGLQNGKPVKNTGRGQLVDPTKTLVYEAKANSAKIGKPMVVNV